MNNDIRWRQRFSNLKRAFKLFKEAVEKLEKLNDLEKEGLIQRFEYVFELSWKTLKDYLENEGFDLNSPKNVIRQAFQSEIIKDSEIWIEALNMRNITIHTYDEKTLNKAVEFIGNFYADLKDLYTFFEEKM
jgi:nucleotidyltransferase substrate binding protein (TIGR01987 family)